MHILFVTSEVETVFKIGGLADVSYALPLALGKHGVRVTVTLPFYKSISPKDVKGVGKLAVDYSGKQEIVFVFTKPMPNPKVTLLLFRHPKLNEYHGEHIEETFAFYSKCISTFYQYGSHLSKYPVDVVHCHDWHTALVPLLIGENIKLGRRVETVQSKGAKTVFTIHNLLYQGTAKSTLISALHSSSNRFHIKGDKRTGSVNMMREGIEYADAVTTVSPTYAKEIIRQSNHGSINVVLRKREKDVYGILNGVDTGLWNPAADHALTHPYDVTTVFKEKPKMKTLLRRELRLADIHVPLFAFIGRIEPRQKGIDITIGALRQLLPEIPIQMIILGTGEKTSTNELKKLASKYKDQLVFLNTFNEVFAHRIYAGSDILVVPSRFEPCGLTQMIAMRYGTIPLVRQTGGLADTVHDRKNGFTFAQYTVTALTQTMKRAYDVWDHDWLSWKRMMASGMQQDFSWETSAKRYIALYKKLRKS